MKSIWKWILGIVVVLALAAGLVGLGFVMYNRMSVRMAQRVAAPNAQTWNGPMNRVPYGRTPPGMMPMMGNRGFGRGFGPFSPGFMFLGLVGRLIPIALLILLLYIAYQFGKRNQPVSAAAAPAPPAASARLCPKCQTPVQNDWKHCPNCGELQAS
ncbi:MAG: zinc ribbon domain-containing protein [Anaerolineales bacterium]